MKGVRRDLGGPWRPLEKVFWKIVGRNEKLHEQIVLESGADGSMRPTRNYGALSILTSVLYSSARLVAQACRPQGLQIT